jgi:phosphoribosylanthranilate isomerase
MTIIKVCGLTSAGDAVSVASLGADIIGLVLAPSLRRISTQLAAEIIKDLKRLPSRPAIAGVFVNEPAENVNSIAGYCGLDMVQLSGNESWDYCSALEFPFIKVIHVNPMTTSVQVIKDLEAGYKAVHGHPFICLLDCKTDSSYGGSGHSFDWDIAEEACSRFPVMVAGGLSPSNVRQLIRKANPTGVDVSSGVESSGMKDMNKVHEFVRSVRLTGGKSSNGLKLLKTILCKGERYVTR